MKKVLVLALFASFASCDDEQMTDLSGSWHFNEPPEVASRFNRLDGSTPAFDVLFEVNGRTITDSDLLINGSQVDETFYSVDHGETVDFFFSYNDFSLKLLKCKRVNQTMYVGTAEYTTASGSIVTYKGISVAHWY